MYNFTVPIICQNLSLFSFLQWYGHYMKQWRSTRPTFFASQVRRTTPRRTYNKESRYSTCLFIASKQTSPDGLILIVSNMTTQIAKLSSPAIISTIAIIMVLMRVGIGIWNCRRTRRSEFQGFSELSAEADRLVAETEKLRREVDECTTAGRVVSIKTLGLLREANEWDTSIRISLATWEDLLQLDMSTSDEESRKGLGMDEKRRKDLIGTMSASCREGMARRKGLGPQLQAPQHMHLESIAR